MPSDELNLIVFKNLKKVSTNCMEKRPDRSID